MKKGKAKAKKSARKAKRAKKVKKAPKKAAAVKPPVHAINWFELPAADFSRACRFYSQVLNVKDLEVMEMGGMRMGMLPAPNGGVGGAVVHGPGYVPTENGTLVYLNGGKDLNGLLNRVEGAGGRVLMQKTLITPDIGYFALFVDSEGNKVALHSRK